MNGGTNDNPSNNKVGDAQDATEERIQEEPPQLTPFQQKVKEVKQLLKSPIQVFFILCGIVALVGIGPFTYYSYKYTEKAIENKPTDYEFPDWRDFKWVLLSVITIGIIDAITCIICLRLFRPICKVQDDLEQREKRSKKAANNIFKFLYYIGISSWGYYILYNKKFFPHLLGGHGDLYLCHEGYPYQQPEHRTGIQEFLLGQLGFSVQQLIRLYAFQEKTRDLLEMTLHEVITIYLYGGCYLTNFWEVGALVSLLHAVSDILIMLSKVLSETTLSNLTACVFVMSMLVWFWMRLIVFPWISWFAATQDIDMGNWLILPFFGYGLFCLVVMHAYWFQLFVKILIHFATKGEAEDKIEEDLSKKNKEGQSQADNQQEPGAASENQIDVNQNRISKPLQPSNSQLQEQSSQNITSNLNNNLTQNPMNYTQESHNEGDIEILSVSEHHNRRTHDIRLRQATQQKYRNDSSSFQTS